MLQSDAPAVRLREIEEWGIPSEAKEAYAFAVLGFLSVHAVAGAVPACTGAQRATALGSITPGLEPLKLPVPATRDPGQIRIESVLSRKE